MTPPSPAAPGPSAPSASEAAHTLLLSLREHAIHLGVVAHRNCVAAKFTLDTDAAALAIDRIVAEAVAEAVAAERARTLEQVSTMAKEMAMANNDFGNWDHVQALMFFKKDIDMLRARAPRGEAGT